MYNETELKQQFYDLKGRSEKLHKNYMKLLEETHNTRISSVTDIFVTNLLAGGSLFMTIENITNAMMTNWPYTAIGTGLGLFFATVASVAGAYSIDAWKYAKIAKEKIKDKKQEMIVVDEQYKETNKALDDLLQERN